MMGLGCSFMRRKIGKIHPGTEIAVYLMAPLLEGSLCNRRVQSALLQNTESLKSFPMQPV